MLKIRHEHLSTLRRLWKIATIATTQNVTLQTPQSCNQYSRLPSTCLEAHEQIMKERYNFTFDSVSTRDDDSSNKDEINYILLNLKLVDMNLTMKKYCKI